jgi:hypothetical protein
VPLLETAVFCLLCADLLVAGKSKAAPGTFLTVNYFLKKSLILGIEFDQSVLITGYQIGIQCMVQSFNMRIGFIKQKRNFKMHRN